MFIRLRDNFNSSYTTSRQKPTHIESKTSTYRVQITKKTEAKWYETPIAGIR
ncbi:MAG: hypothetical protein QRY74_01455 [Chlamydia sp.]